MSSWNFLQIQRDVCTLMRIMRSLAIGLRYCVLCFVLCFGGAILSCDAQATPHKAAAQALFDFHSDFWINLHHFLYLEALSQTPQKSSHPTVVSQPDVAVLKTLSQEERASWDAAVAYYATSMIQHDLLFDQNMGIIKDELEDAEGSPDLAKANIPADLKVLLLKVAPIYRAHWWKSHDEQNQQWIAQTQLLVQRYGQTLKDSLVRIYESPWPGDPVRVDATIFASQFGVYTTNWPTRPTISTTDPANQGVAALEVVFHETSHGMMEKVMDAMRTAETNVNAKRPDGAFHSGTLWHAVLFYTAGELVAEQIPGYVPYADKNGLWVRAWSGPDQGLIEKDWKPHMQGETLLSTAIAHLVNDVAATPPHP